jgi:hypothetical protein
MPDIQALIGTWEKVSGDPKSDVYPRILTFKENGLYTGTGASPSAEKPWWDIGTFDIVSGDEIKISTANDMMVTYQFNIEENTLTFIDPEKCRFSYRKIQ